METNPFGGPLQDPFHSQWYGLRARQVQLCVAMMYTYADGAAARVFSSFQTRYSLHESPDKKESREMLRETE